LRKVADELLFNSEYNLSSFLGNITKHLKTQPDFRPDAKTVVEKISQKSRVLYFPIYEDLKSLKLGENESKSGTCLHIVWPHRWEHDKNPEAFFQALYRLEADGLEFKISVLGETYSAVPPVFEEARSRLKDHIANFGFPLSKDEYHDILRSADVVVSTALHETFGVAMLEATFLGCYPLVPNRLVYPEIYPVECIYSTETQLYKRLKQFAQYPKAAREHSVTIDFKRFSIDNSDIFFK